MLFAITVFGPTRRFAVACNAVPNDVRRVMPDETTLVKTAAYWAPQNGTRIKEGLRRVFCKAALRREHDVAPDRDRAGVVTRWTPDELHQELSNDCSGASTADVYDLGRSEPHSSIRFHVRTVAGHGFARRAPRS
jgi:hypothetical protein